MIVLILHELNRLGGTLRGADAAAVALGRIDLGKAFLVDEGHSEGAGPHADEAGGAHLAIDLGHQGAQIDAVPGQEGLGPACRGLGLGEGFAHGFGRVRGAGHKEPRNRQVDGPELDVVFEKVAVLSPGQAKDRAQVLAGLLVGHHAGAQGQAIRGKLRFLRQDRVSEAHGHLAAVGFDPRHIFQFIGNKDDPLLPGPPVIILLKARGAHIPIEHEHLGGGIQFLKLESVFDRSRAAHPGAVGIIRHPGADTLNHGNFLPVLDLFRVIFQKTFQIELRAHRLMPPQEVLVGPVGECAGGQDGDAVADFPVEHLGTHLEAGPKHAGQARVVHHHGLLPDLDAVVGLGSLDEIRDIGHHVFAFQRPANLFGHAAQLPGTFHQVDLIARVREPQGRRHSGNTAAHHQNVLVHGQGLIRQGAGQAHRRHRHAHQVLGLGRGINGPVRVDPGVLVAQVSDFHQVFVQARLADGFLKQPLMGPGRAGAHHHPIEILQPDLSLDMLQRFAAAAVADGFGHRYLGQIGHARSDVLHIDHPADI